MSRNTFINPLLTLLLLGDTVWCFVLGIFLNKDFKFKKKTLFLYYFFRRYFFLTVFIL